MYVACLLYPFIHLWTLKLLPHLGYCTQWCHDLWVQVLFINFGSLWIYPRYEITMSVGTFFFLRTSIIFSLVGVPVPTNSVGGFTSLHTLFRIYTCRFFEMVILTDVRWCLTGYLICLSLRSNDAEHLCMCFMAISVTLFRKCAFRYLDDFLLGGFFFFVFFCCWAVGVVCMC